jgi:hypothetical protein
VESVGRRLHAQLERLVDFYHTTEKLSAAAQVLEDSAAAAGEREGGWKQALLHRSGAAADILKKLIASGRDEGVGTEHPVHEAITYLQNHGCETDRMNYARARRLGLALGTGNVEATCKSLFEMRMKRWWARWKQDTGQHIVQLRAVALSDRWEPAIELTLRPPTDGCSRSFRSVSRMRATPVKTLSSLTGRISGLPLS